MGKAEFEAQYEKRLRSLGVCIEVLERESQPSALGSVVVYDVRFKLDADDGTSVLAILKGCEGGRLVIAFVGASSLGECLFAVKSKLAKETLRWREDRPWGE